MPSSDVQIIDDVRNSSHPAGNRPKVLVVDDEAFNVQVITLTMKTTMGLKENEDYREAFGGQEAVDIVKSFGNDNPFVVILMDLTMPNVDGLQASKLIMDYCKE